MKKSKIKDKISKTQTQKRKKFFNFYVCVFYFWFFIFYFAYAQALPHPQWETYGRLINDTVGNSPQQNPQMINNGRNEYILVWEDGRAGNFNIYAQKINEAGEILWELGGVAICQAEENQNFPQLAPDGEGGAIIVWQDYRSGNADIFAQRIDAAGRILWEKDGAAVSTAAAGQFAPKIADNGIIVWHDYRSEVGEDIYAQKIGINGRVFWKKDGLPISTAAGTQWYPEIVEDGEGGAVIAWTDGRGSSDNTDIYAQRIDASGKILWEKDGLAICNIAGNQDHPKVIRNEYGNFVFAWTDFRIRVPNIYVQKMDGAGNPLWLKSGLVVALYPMNQLEPSLASDGMGGALVAWQDQRDDLGNIYVQRMRSDGARIWGNEGKPLCKKSDLQFKPSAFSALHGSWIVLWQDREDLFAQKITSSGLFLWKESGLPVAALGGIQEKPVAMVNQNNELVAAWQDSRFGSSDIYVQKLNPEGEQSFGAYGKLVNASIGSVVQQNIQAVETTSGEIIIVFEDQRSGYFNVYAQKLNRAGQISWDRAAIPLAKVSGNQQDPQILGDGEGGAMVAWKDSRHFSYSKIYAQRISSSGELLWGKEGLALTSILSSQDNPCLVADGEGGAIAGWAEERSSLDMRDVYAQRISKEGKLLWGKNGKEVCFAASDQIKLVLAADGAGGAYVAWEDFRFGDRNPDIYAQRINAQGKILWGEEGVSICGAPDFQGEPALVKDQKGGALISWTDKSGGSYDIYVQRINKSGQPAWLIDGIPASQVPRTQQNAKLSPSGILVWEDFRFGHWDIFAQKVILEGKFAWEEGGIPIVVAPFTQYAPQIKEKINGDLFVVWEDYRSGRQYDIYAQRINQNGQILWPENGVEVKTLAGGRAPQVLVSRQENSFYVFWEDHRDGGRAIYGQKFSL